MEFTGFTKQDFETFHIDGLDTRMEAIRERIQPKFKAIGEALIDPISETTGMDMHVHIARHARRTKNPPNDTWMAFCHDKRGYKKHPHFQVGLFDDHLFMWLAYIYELPQKQDIATTFLNHTDDITENIPDDYVISLDHTKKDATALKDIDLNKALKRFYTVKKAEFLIGKHIKAGDPVLNDPNAFLQDVITTFQKLTPLYKISMD